MTKKLKPEPCWCGGEAIISQETLSDYIVICGKCEIRTKYYPSKDEAVEAWNKVMDPKRICSDCGEEMRLYWHCPNYCEE